MIQSDSKKNLGTNILDLIPEYLQVNEKISSNRFINVYQIFDRKRNRQRTLKMPATNERHLNALITWEFHITRSLALKGVWEPDSIHHTDSGLYYTLGPALDGVSLIRVTELTPGETLQVCQDSLAILAALHEHKITVNQFSLEDFHWDKNRQYLMLTNLCFSTNITSHWANAHHPSSKDEALYLSPELTGRMNRLVDQRSDLYVMGLTWYQFVTGNHPFDAPTADEIIHRQIAQTAPPIESEINGFPEQLAKPIAKMLSKNPEARYSSSKELLQEISTLTTQTNQIAEGELQLVTDPAIQFHIPQKLYGRNSEIVELKNIYSNVCKNKTGLHLISGPSGIGKTALVQELNSTITLDKGLFLSGKSSPLSKQIPYAAWLEAFDMAIAQIQHSEQSEIWKELLGRELEDYSALLIRYLPRLAELIVDKKPLNTVKPTSLRSRMTQAFSQLLRCFLMNGHPLVIFLDDLQWADPESLELISLLMQEIKRQNCKKLLLIGAYRDNEVHSAHPLLVTLEELKSLNLNFNVSQLKPLDDCAIQDWLNDSLSYHSLCPQENRNSIHNLAELIYERSKGNAFYVSEFIKNLTNDHIICFDKDKKSWELHVESLRLSIENPKYKNGNTLILHRLSQLPLSTQEILWIASCLGNSFDIDLVSHLVERSIDEVLDAFWQCFEVGLLVPLGNLQSWNPILRHIDREELLTARFQHDRILQAAYDAIPGTLKETIHSKIGRYYLTKIQESEDFDLLFKATEHCMHSIDQFSDPHELNRVIDLLTRTAERAKLQAAFSSAQSIANLAYLALDKLKGRLPSYTALKYRILTIKAECHYLLNQPTLGNESFESAWRYADKKDMSQLLYLELIYLMSNSQFDDAKVKGLGCISQSSLCNRFAKLTLEDAIEALYLETNDFFHNPRAFMEYTKNSNLDKVDNYAVASLPYLGYLGQFTADAQLIEYSCLLGLYSIKTVGVNKYTGFILACLSFLCMRKHSLPLAVEVSELSREYYKGNEQAVDYAGATNVIGLAISFYGENYDDSISLHRDGARKGFVHGDVLTAASNYSNITHHLYAKGLPLEEVARHAKEVALMCEHYKVFANTGSFYLDLCEALENPDQYDQDTSNSPFQRLTDTTQHTSQSGLIHQIQVQFLFWSDQWEKLPELFHIADETCPHIEGFFLSQDYCFIKTIVALTTSLGDQSGMEHYEMLCGINSEIFESRLLTLKAYHQWHIDKDLNKAYNLLQSAYAISNAQNDLPMAGFIKETQAKLQLSLCSYISAFSDLSLSYDHYQIWGNNFKINRLTETYHVELEFHLKNQIEKRSLLFDDVNIEDHKKDELQKENNHQIETIIQLTQKIGSRRGYRDLVETAMKIICQNSGADRGYMVKNNSGSPVTQCYFNIDKDEKPVFISHPMNNPAGIDLDCLQICIDSGEEQIRNPTRNGDIGKSGGIYTLTVPLRYGSTVKGAIHLENKNINTFTGSNIKLIRILVGQLAISMELAIAHEEQIQLSSKLEIALQREIGHSEAKTDFLGLINHEFRTPLYHLLGFIDIFKSAVSGKLNSEEKTTFNHIESSSKHLRDLIISLLTERAIAIGELQLSPTEVDSATFVNSIRNNTAPFFSGREIDYTIEFSGDNTLLLLDSEKLQISILNVLHNASKYTNFGAVSLKIFNSVKLGALQFEIADTGVGIKDDDIERIFLPFEKSCVSGQPNEGIGLGLYISKQMIKLHGGTIEAHSAVGRGSTFVITIPQQSR